jgi:hypothetical protein
LSSPFSDVLVARIEAAHVPTHRNDAGLLGDLDQVLSILDRIRDRNLDQHVLAGAHHLLALAEMHLGRRGEDHGVGPLDPFGELARVVGDAVLLGDLRGGILIAADQRADLDARNALQGIEMLLAERALAGDADLHAAFLSAFFFGAFAAAFFAGFEPFSRMMCPTAVFEAGTV